MFFAYRVDDTKTRQTIYLNIRNIYFNIIKYIIREKKNTIQTFVYTSQIYKKKIFYANRIYNRQWVLSEHQIG